MAQMIDVSPNWQKAETPYSRFGTRKVQWYTIGHVGTRTSPSYAVDPAKMAGLRQLIQTQMEIIMVGHPRAGSDWGRFMIAVSADTANDGDNTDSHYVNAKSRTLQDILEQYEDDTIGDGDVEVEKRYIWSDEFVTDDTYAEADLKADIVPHDGN
jgi:hypothetical protein